MGGGVSVVTGGRVRSVVRCCSWEARPTVASQPPEHHGMACRYIGLAFDLAHKGQIKIQNVILRGL